MFKLPKELLVDSFVYQKYLGVDRNHVPSYDDEVQINHVRIDRAAVYTRDGSESSKRADATIYCFSYHTDPFPEFITQSKVSFEGNAYTITDVRAFTHPFSNQIAVYELEVVK